MSSIKAKEMTVNYVDVETERISSTELQENERSKGQRIAYPRYEHPTLGPNQALMIQFPWIKLETYGVPRAGEYYKSDNDRAFVKVPLNSKVPEVASLIEKVKAIDAYFASEEFASKLIGKKWNKYTYQPIYRESNIPVDDDSDDETKKQPVAPKLPYLKLKIDTEYESGAIKTKLYRSEMVDGKRQRTEVTDMKALDDFTRLVAYQSNFRPIIRVVKFWAQPLTKKDPTWGATLKIVKAEVEPSTKGNNMYKDYMNSDAFLDSDDEQQPKVQNKSSAPVVTKKVVAQVESDDSDSDEDVKETKPASKQVVAQVESDDSDSESEPEEKKPVAKTASKKPAPPVESDDDDSEDEKPAPKKAPAKPVARGKGKTAHA